MPSSCPKCGKPLEVYNLKGIKYLDCSGYPKCRYRVELGKVNQSFNIDEQNGKITYPKVCPNCGSRIAIYIGKNGAFFGCNGYPHCRFSFSIESTKNVICPDCNNLMYERNGSRGIFLGCGNYPDCRFTCDIRISKNVESSETPVNSQRKKIIFDQLETPITNDKILKILSKD
jgi:DNA topoisomerase-1